MKFTSEGSVFEVVETTALEDGPWTHAIKARSTTDEQELTGLALVVNGFVVNALITS